jgi:hypothetical protein
MTSESKPKPKPMPRWFGLACYPCQVGVATTAPQHAALLSGLGLKSAAPDTPGRTVSYVHEETQRCRIVVWLQHKPVRSLAGLVGLCAHEAAHVVEYVAEYIGEKQFSSEANAYLLEAVTRLCFSEYTRLSPDTRFIED